MSLKLPKKKESTSGITALIDMDVIRYQVGFACQKKQEDGTIVADPIEYCLHSVKVFLHSVMEATDAQFHKGYLTGKGNFREELATILVYKGNRKQEKPIHYQAITEYLINVWDAQIIDMMEADDQLSIEQMRFFDAGADFGYGKPTDTVICTIDKDLDNTPGWHYNWNKEKLYWVTEDEATYNFYKQLLTGDATDHIQGIKGIGPKKAEKILEGCSTELEMYAACLKAYQEAHNTAKTIPPGRAVDVLLENAHLLWMLRELNEDGSPVHWSPPA